MSPRPGPSPFTRAETRTRRLKLFLWGDAGVGKTTLALQFPAPAVIDMEGGTDLYGAGHAFDVLRASTADEVSDTVDWLLANPHRYSTLVLDPVSVYWDALQKKWSDIFLQRNKQAKGYRFEYFDLGPKEWAQIKLELKDLVRRLTRLDMNVIVTARQKLQYSDDAFMKVIGETFDAERTLPYLFDTVVHLSRDAQGRHLGRSIKDRTRRLPVEPFEVSYAVFEKAFGVELLTRESLPVPVLSSQQQQLIRELLRDLDITEQQAARRFQKFGAERLEELSTAAAGEIIEKLRKAHLAKVAHRSLNQGA